MSATTRGVVLSLMHRWLVYEGLPTVVKGVPMAELPRHMLATPETRAKLNMRQRSMLRAFRTRIDSLARESSPEPEPEPRASSVATGLATERRGKPDKPLEQCPECGGALDTTQRYNAGNNAFLKDAKASCTPALYARVRASLNAEGEEMAQALLDTERRLEDMRAHTAEQKAPRAKRARRAR